MSHIDVVLTQYASATLSNSTTLPTKKVIHSVPSLNSHPALRALRVDLPDLFEQAIVKAKGGLTGYITKGSCGQLNFNFANVPWVAAFDKSITRGASNGFYIVLLFSEKSDAAYLTLNQSFTAFRDIYGSAALATQKIRDCASVATQLLLGNIPTGFLGGPINLSATADLGQGYEAGCILSKQYKLNDGHTNLDIERDFTALLKTYDLLITILNGASITSLEITFDEGAFQAAVNDTQNNGTSNALPPGGLPPPQMGQSAGKTKYLRSPAVAGRVVSKSKGICALTTSTEPHKSFICGKRRLNYVEGHHLIPFSQQPNFSFSLDVDENIVPLCPNCHRLLHHAKFSERKKLLHKLLTVQKNGLVQRMIPVELKELITMYGALGTDD